LINNQIIKPKSKQSNDAPMSRGGKRQGAGRPQGAAAKLDVESREKAKREGVAPLDIMISMIKAEIEAGAPDRDFLLKSVERWLSRAIHRQQ
jgi:hypothetical protein